MQLQEIKKIIVSQKEEMQEILSRGVIQREIDIKKTSKFLKKPNVLAILGIRRCGKTTLSWQILKGKNFGYINFDDERLFGLKTEDLDKILQAFYELYGKIEYFILDEPQNIKGWELFVNRLRRTKKLIITGSNSNLLSGELASSLTGRYIDFTLFPFSFREYLLYKGISFNKTTAYSSESIGIIKKVLKEYLRLGGLPEAITFGRRMIVRIYADIIEKDVLKRKNIRKKSIFRELSKYLVALSSNEFTFKKLTNIFKLKDVHTTREWIRALEEAYLLFTLPRFSFKLKQQMIAPKKIYCLDTGVVNSLSFKFSENIGALMENLVAVELLRRKHYFSNDLEIYYWKDHQNREVDFVLKKGGRVEELVQVCYDLENPTTKEREIKNLLKASRELKCSNLSIITWDFEAVEKIQDTEIKILPLWKWLIFKNDQ